MNKLNPTGRVYMDPHIHMYARTTDDYFAMHQAGIRATVEPAFWLGQPRRHPGSFFDYFEHLCGYEVERAANHGITLHATLAMNPREANDVELSDAVLAELPRYLEHPRVVAVGEIGTDDNTPREMEVMRRQVEMAREAGLPLLVHTPHRDKLEGTKMIVDALREMGVEGDDAVVDHCTEETIGPALDAGYWAAMTVYPVTKMSPARAVNVLREHGCERTWVNSSADWGPSDCLSVPRVAEEMRMQGFSAADISRVTFDNAVTFLRRSGRLQLPAELERTADEQRTGDAAA